MFRCVRVVMFFGRYYAAVMELSEGMGALPVNHSPEFVTRKEAIEYGEKWAKELNLYFVG